MSEQENKRELSEVIGRDLVQVMTDEHGLRYIWMLGYGQRDENRTLGFVWVSFHFCILPLEAFLNDERLDGVLANKLYNGGERVSLEELDEDDCLYYYSDADTEEPIPFFVRDPDIPDGYYIV